MTQANKYITCTIKFTPEEMKEIDNSWKHAEGFLNRTEYFRAAINHFIGREVCAPRKYRHE